MRFEGSSGAASTEKILILNNLEGVSLSVGDLFILEGAKSKLSPVGINTISTKENVQMESLFLLLTRLEFVKHWDTDAPYVKMNLALFCPDGAANFMPFWFPVRELRGPAGAESLIGRIRYTCWRSGFNIETVVMMIPAVASVAEENPITSRA